MKAVLFCAWLSWSRFRVALPIRGQVSAGGHRVHRRRAAPLRGLPTDANLFRGYAHRTVLEAACETFCVAGRICAPSTALSGVPRQLASSSALRGLHVELSRLTRLAASKRSLAIPPW